MSDEVLYERRGPLALITLNRPDRLNALTTPMIGQITARAREAEADPKAIAICVTGAGRGFCAGIDAERLTQVTNQGFSDRAADYADKTPGLFAEFIEISKPIIAAVNGPAAGAGFILAMMADLRFVAEGAVMTTVFSKRGLIAEHNAAYFLPRIVGVGRALDLLWSSRRLDAAEALRIGLADRTAQPGELIAAVETYVADLAANVSPRAMAIMKAQVYRQLALPLDTAARETEALLQAGLKHPDAKEGAVSFVERRPPNFAPWTGAGS